jgi:hypothetical protein
MAALRFVQITEGGGKKKEKQIHKVDFVFPFRHFF